MLYRFMTAAPQFARFRFLVSPGSRCHRALMLKASPALTILAADEENPEVENLLDPEATNGVPGGPTEATPGDEPKPEGEMKAKPEGGDSEMKEMKEEGK